jgi:hypothetical protein
LVTLAEAEQAARALLVGGVGRFAVGAVGRFGFVSIFALYVFS